MKYKTLREIQHPGAVEETLMRQFEAAATALNAPVDEVESGRDDEFWHRERCVNVAVDDNGRIATGRVYDY